MSSSASAELTAYGYATFGPSEKFKPHEFTRRAPGPNDVAIEIKYCGICHSDIHTARNEWRHTTYPCIPGHEIAGIVKAVGANVTKFSVGDRVGVGCLVNSCRTCDECKESLEQFCPKATGTYNSLDTIHLAATGEKRMTYGGYSNLIVVDQDFVLRIPESIPLAEAAPLLCAGITLYSPLAHWKCGPGKRVAIVGCGGLGHLGIKIAAKMGAHVIALSQTLNKLDDMLKFGAAEAYATSDPSTFEKLNRSLDLIVNTVSANIGYDQYIRLLKRDGTMVLVGAPENPTPISSFSLISGRRSLAGSPIGGIRETQEMLDFCAQHGISAQIELINADQIDEAYERVVRSNVKYRFVIDASTFGPKDQKAE